MSVASQHCSWRVRSTTLVSEKLGRWENTPARDRVIPGVISPPQTPPHRRPSFHSGRTLPIPTLDLLTKSPISAFSGALCTQNPAKRGATTGSPPAPVSNPPS